MNNLRWIGHANTLFDMQRSLRDNMESCEITLVAKGYSVRAHRFVLSSCSDLLRALLDNVPIGQEASILVPDIKGTLLDSVISFVYLGETSLSSVNLTEFLEAINLLGIKSAISFECNTTAFTATQQQHQQQQQSHQQQQQQQQSQQQQQQQTNTNPNIQQTSIPTNATIKTIGDIQIIHEELMDADTKIENHQVLNDDDVHDNTRQLEFLDVYGGGNGPGTNSASVGGAGGGGVGVTGSTNVTGAGGVVGDDETQAHKITYSIEEMTAPTNNSNYIITENSGTFTLTHQNTKLENASSAASSSCCGDKIDDVDEVITEDSIDPDMTTDADIIEDFDDVNDPLLEMTQQTQQHHQAHHNLNTRSNATTNTSLINVPNNNRHPHSKPSRVKVQVKWKQQQPQQQEQRMPLQQTQHHQAHQQQQQQHHQHHHQTQQQQQQHHHHQQQQQHEIHDLELHDDVDEDEDDVDEDNDNDNDNEEDDEELEEHKHDNNNYHHDNDCKDFEIDDVDVDDVDNLSYKLDTKNLLIIDPISVKGDINCTTHEHSINLAVQAVINEGISLQKAAHKYNISKTVLWRRVRKHPNYMKTSRENPVLKLAYERLKEGDSLKNISRDLDIPMSTLHRHKVRLAQEGRLPKYTAFKKRGSMSKDELKEKLSKAVYACIHDGMSQNKSANLFDIPKSTLWRHLQKRVAEAELLQKNNTLEIKEEIILS